MRAQHNLKGHIKLCAFCKYWYDPTNTAISPKFPKQGIWEYDRDAKFPCLKKDNPRNLRPSHSQACGDYECKIQD